MAKYNNIFAFVDYLADKVVDELGVIIHAWWWYSGVGFVVCRVTGRVEHMDGVAFFAQRQNKGIVHGALAEGARNDYNDSGGHRES